MMEQTRTIEKLDEIASMTLPLDGITLAKIEADGNNNTVAALILQDAAGHRLEVREGRYRGLAFVVPVEDEEVPEPV